MFSWSRLELKQKLGSGAFSNVHLAVLKGAQGQSSTNVAVKMNISGSSSTLMKEAKMICHLRHPNLVKIYGVSTEPMVQSY
jgi:serine/threonine protein kinase